MYLERYVHTYTQTASSIVKSVEHCVNGDGVKKGLWEFIYFNRIKVLYTGNKCFLANEKLVWNHI